VLSDKPVHRVTIRAALLLGFGLTVGLWIVTGFQFTRRIADVQRDAAAINRRYTSAQELLSTVRAQLLIGSVYARDALLDPNPAASETYRRQLHNTYTAVDAALDRYVPVLDTAVEQARIVRLRQEVGMFRATMLEVLESRNARGGEEARLLLQRRIVPKREVVIRASEEAQALNREAFVQQQDTIAEVYRVMHHRLWQQLGLALVASLGIAVLASLYAGRLEGRLRRQQARDAQNTEDLQRLSAKLITAQEEERRNIARELHDEVGQVLTAIKVELAVAQTAIEAFGAPVRVLEDARVITEGALQTVRDLSHLLHPSMLDDLGLVAALDWYLRGASKRHDLRGTLQHEGMGDGDRLAVETEVAAFRIVQEALTNVVKHAHARSCHVALVRRDHTLHLTIADDGIGIDLACIDSRGRRGLGLVGIRERIIQLSGSFRIERGAAGGTKLVVELPARSRATVEAPDRLRATGAEPPPMSAARSPSSVGVPDGAARPALAIRGRHG
jgi:signal transduction histidine kinase